MSTGITIHQIPQQQNDQYFKSIFPSFEVAWGFFKIAESAQRQPIAPSPSEFSRRYQISIEKANQIFLRHQNMEIWRCDVSTGTNNLNNFLSPFLYRLPDIMKTIREMACKVVGHTESILDVPIASLNDKVYGVCRINFSKQASFGAVHGIRFYLTGELNASRRKFTERFFEVTPFFFQPDKNNVCSPCSSMSEEI